MKLIIHGCGGKMGSILFNMCEEYGHEVYGVMLKESNKKNIVKDINKISDKFSSTCDALIDFSHNNAIPNYIEFCKIKKINAVICTTGLSENNIDLIKKTSKHIAILKSSNVSSGINLINLILEKISQSMLKMDFDIDIIEKHHKNKPDAPSGTALLFSETINNSLEKNKLNIKFDNKNYIREKNDLAITSIRSGNSKGEHSIIFESDRESIMIKHKAYSREIFAEGALKAAEFIKDKKSGLYSSKDIFKNLL